MAGKKTHYAIIDIETTGGDPKKERITEIAIFVHDGTQVVDQFCSLVNPEIPIPDFITQITGIDNDMVRDAPRFYEIARQVVELTQDAVFVAHNVRFDYSFVQKEFRQLGYTYTRRQLCTFQLARKLLPGLRSYSLKNLCSYLHIDNEARHRAGGDAKATVQLFEILMRKQAGPRTSEILSLQISDNNLPPHLARATVEALPETTGVYYFHGPQGEVLYVGKSNNIRKRVLSHFQGAHKAARTLRMIEQIHDLSYEHTGSELLALLLENEEIKRLQPPYNRKQRRQQFKAAIYAGENEAGYRCFWIDDYDEAGVPLAGFAGREAALGTLEYYGRELQLCPKLYGAEKGPGRCFHRQIHICHGACEGTEDPDDYNTRARQFEAALSYGRKDLESFLVIGAGRHDDERSVVWVQGGRYRGYTWLDAHAAAGRTDDILEAIQPRREAPDVRLILRGYVRKHPHELRPLD
ncbi:MAG: exonuclease domain-containing protein [Bacteroidia bacterium]